MDQEILGCQQDFQMTVTCPPSTPEELYTNTVIMTLQQILIDQQFQKLHDCYVQENFYMWQDEEGVRELFGRYQSQIGNVLVQKVVGVVGHFDIKQFYGVLCDNRERVDMGVYEAVAICVSFEDFYAFFNDYRKAAEQQQRYRVLTIKTNKLPQTKKVKSNTQNIFASSNKPIFKVAKKPTDKQTNQKTQHELLVPETVLTVKGYRKC